MKNNSWVFKKIKLSLKNLYMKNKKVLKAKIIQKIIKLN